MIAIPALISAYFLANYTARTIGNTVLANVTSDVAKQASKAAQASNLGGGAEVDGFSKTLSSLDISIQPLTCYHLCTWLSSCSISYGTCFKQSPL